MHCQRCSSNIMTALFRRAKSDIYLQDKSVWRSKVSAFIYTNVCKNTMKIISCSYTVKVLRYDIGRRQIDIAMSTDHYQIIWYILFYHDVTYDILLIESRHRLWAITTNFGCH